MTDRIKWTARKFEFGQPLSQFPMTLERLRGTIVRLEHWLRVLSDEQLKNKKGDAWSVQEHIGHLADLEELHEGRIDDFLAGKEILRAADMTNSKTYASAHNEKAAADILEMFKQKRNRFISRLEELPDEALERYALHPRLQVMMRPVDMALFTAEHDDQHFAIIREITGNFMPTNKKM